MLLIRPTAAATSAGTALSAYSAAVCGALSQLFVKVVAVCLHKADGDFTSPASPFRSLAPYFALGGVAFTAPLQHIFLGEGRVHLNGDASGRVYPQWWGAQTNRGSAPIGSPPRWHDGVADADAAIQSASLSGILEAGPSPSRARQVRCGRRWYRSRRPW